MVHFVTPEDQEALRRWFEAQGGDAFDNGADAGDGALFIRRGDFGRFMAAQFAAYQADNPSNSQVQHVQDCALGIEKQGGRYRISLEGGGPLDSDLAIVATSNERPAIPGPFAPVADHPAFLADPWDPASIQAAPKGARLLIIGTALTAADVIVTLLRRGHSGHITALSRHGLRSTRRVVTQNIYATPFWDRIGGETSLFVERHGPQTRLLDLLRTIRADIRSAVAEGEPWQAPFDDLRDSVWQIWPALPLAEKRRFMRHLRIWYDAHRFRLPPQLEPVLDAAEAAGQLRYKAAHVTHAQTDGNRIAVLYRPRHSTEIVEARYDAVINCTGPQSRPDRAENPFMRSLVANGLARPHPVGIGFDVDDDCAAIGTDGAVNPQIRVFGPLTLGQFGDPQGTPFILRHICRVMPQIVDQLAAG